MDSKRVLIVDDESALLELMRRYLERNGYSVTTAADPLEALNLFRASPSTYAMVVTDLTMEHMTGEELIIAMRQTQPGLRAIIASGYPHQPQLPDVGFLQKPILPKVLADAIQKALGFD